MTLPVNVMALSVNVMARLANVMARLVRATWISTMPREVPRTSRGMTNASRGKMIEGHVIRTIHSESPTCPIRYPACG